MHSTITCFVNGREFCTILYSCFITFDYQCLHTDNICASFIAHVSSNFAFHNFGYNLFHASHNFNNPQYISSNIFVAYELIFVCDNLLLRILIGSEAEFLLLNICTG